MSKKKKEQKRMKKVKMTATDLVGSTTVEKPELPKGIKLKEGAVFFNVKTKEFYMKVVLLEEEKVVYESYSVFLPEKRQIVCTREQFERTLATGHYENADKVPKNLLNKETLDAGLRRLRREERRAQRKELEAKMDEADAEALKIAKRRGKLKGKHKEMEKEVKAKIKAHANGYGFKDLVAFAKDQGLAVRTSAKDYGHKVKIYASKESQFKPVQAKFQGGVVKVLTRGGKKTPALIYKVKS